MSMTKIELTPKLSDTVELPTEQVAESFSYDYNIPPAEASKARWYISGLTVVFVLLAPAAQFFFPDAWMIVLSTALAFTIGTNLLISVITVSVEDRAVIMQRSMDDLAVQLGDATQELLKFHDAMDQADIGGIQNTVSSSLDDITPAAAHVSSIIPELTRLMYSAESSLEILEEKFKTVDYIESQVESMVTDFKKLRLNIDNAIAAVSMFTPDSTVQIESEPAVDMIIDVNI